MKLFKKNSDADVLMEGLYYGNESDANNENRIFTLLAKGFICYLIVAGSIGCAVTATSSAINHVVFNLTVLLLCMLVSLIYYNKLTENLGDILYLILVAFCGIYFRSYINSGFYTWMNDLLGAAGSYFDLNDIGGYATENSNSYFSLTFASCFLGAVFVLIIYMSIVKKMHYADIIFFDIVVLALPAYMELEPNFFYVALMLLGVLLCFIWAQSGVYSKTNNNLKFKRDKNKISYVFDIRAILLVFGQIIALIIVLLSLLYVIFPKDYYSLIRKRSEFKNSADSFVQSFVTSGIGAFFNRYESVGGMSSGRLGGVNSISLDYETDISVTFCPYNYNPVYLRTFVGGEYVPYYDYWTVATTAQSSRDEYDYLSKLYDEGNEYSGRGVMLIENVAGEHGEYMPYYSAKYSSISVGSSAERVYYTRLDDSLVNPDFEPLSEEEYEYYTKIPQENLASVEAFVKRAGLSEDMDETQVANAIREYFVLNVPYTLRPGATPRRKDFINYFLDNNRKGYCVHFASAAVMALRYMGIPARYVEGYCIDSQAMENAVLTEDDVTDYYEGYSQLDESAVICVDVSDASAHAWVEAYIDGYGWTVCEFTPPSSDSDNSQESLLSRLLSIFGTDSSIDDDGDNDSQIRLNTSRIRKILTILLGSILLAFIIKAMVTLTALQLKYKKADLNDRLIICYHYYRKRKARRNAALKDSLTYGEDVKILFEALPPTEREMISEILNKAGFSNKEISRKEFDYVRNKLH